MLLSLPVFAQESSKGISTQMTKLLTAYRMISTLYVEEVEEKKVVESAIIAMLKDLDPHSAYISPEDVKKMNEPLQGNFDGIGIQFNVLNDTLIVVATIPGGPSEKVGLKAGDRIVKVDTSTIAGVKCERSRMLALLRGKKGTKVNVKVKRKGIQGWLAFTITRDKIPIHSLDAAYMIDAKIGYIKLNRFSATTYDEFMSATEKLRQEGMEQLIIDLQGNGGGYMRSVIDIVNELLPPKRMIVYTEGHHSAQKDFNSRGGGSFEKGDLLVLIDETSASASEILAGAVQDWDRGLIVGRRSYGKGLVQKQLRLPDGAVMRLTTARYHTPSGRCIQKPYEKGKQKEYNRELSTRFESGELLSADSIHFPDSLKYKTLIKGRTVYGGGGIIPDVFVPLDTTEYSDFLHQVISSGVLNHFMLTYMDDNRTALKEKYDADFKRFDAKFELGNVLFQHLITEAEKDSIIYKEEKRSDDFLRLQMKALVARDLFGTSEYYQVMNQRNASFIKALELF